MNFIVFPKLHVFLYMRRDLWSWSVLHKDVNMFSLCLQDFKTKPLYSVLPVITAFYNFHQRVLYWLQYFVFCSGPKFICLDTYSAGSNPKKFGCLCNLTNLFSATQQEEPFSWPRIEHISTFSWRVLLTQFSICVVFLKMWIIWKSNLSTLSGFWSLSFTNFCSAKYSPVKSVLICLSCLWNLHNNLLRCVLWTM